MSSTSPQAKTAAENSAWQAGLAQQLSGITLPELQKILGSEGIASMLAGSIEGRLPQDYVSLNAATGQLNQGYNNAQNTTAASINYGALRSGEGRRSPGAVSSALGGAATGLERDRTAALRNLEFASAQSSMSDYNKVLQLLGQGANTSLGLAQGFSGASNAAIGGLSGNTQMGNILGGASAGAGLGTSIYPGWGTAIGAVVGGIYGATQNP
jgi:hypothetical protein